jgi:hypothetical protein
MVTWLSGTAFSTVLGSDCYGRGTEWRLARWVVWILYEQRTGELSGALTSTGRIAGKRTGILKHQFYAISTYFNAWHRRGLLMKILSVTALIYAAFNVLPQVIYALPIVDQAFVPSPSAAYVGMVEATYATETESAQTFTVGLTGQLTKVEVKVSRYASFTGPLGVFVVPTIGGVPDDTTVLGYSVFAGDTISTAWNNNDSNWLAVDLTSFGISVSSGDVLAIVLATDNPSLFIEGLYAWHGDSGNPYSGGNLFWTTNASPDWTAVSDADLGFRTFVESRSGMVPEPSTLVLLVSGLIIVFCLGIEYRARDVS